MALPGVKINIGNGGLGRSVAVAKVPAMICSGVAVVGKIALLEPKQIFNVASLDTLGIVETSNPLLYNQVKNFYAIAGNAELWIMLVSDTTLMQDVVLATNNIATKLLDAANGSIGVLGIHRKTPTGYVPTIVEGLDGDVIAAINNADALAKQYATQNKPLRILIPALGLTKANISNLKNLRANTNERVACVLGCDAVGSVAIGLTLGKIATIGVHQNIGRVKDGDVGILNAYLPDGTFLKDIEGSWGSIHDKGYIFFRTHINRNGWYYNDDPACVSNASDYSSLSKGFVIDKAHRIAFDVFLNELLDTIEVDSNTGKLSNATLGYYKTEIENAIKTQMLSNGEIGSVSCTIDNTQNILRTDKLAIGLKITPKGSLKSIEVNLGFGINS